MTAPLSRRGQQMVEGALPAYLTAHVERRDDPGYVGLCIAENHGVFDLLRPRLEAIPPVPAHVTAYDDMGGGAALRTAVAGLFERHVFGRPVDPGHVRVLAGAGGVLDALGHVLGDPGDGVVVPTPSYAGFWPDLEVRPGLTVLPARADPADGFAITPDLLQRTVDAADVPVRALLLTNPDNPRGTVMPAGDVAAVLDWADDVGLHVVADEVYALSAFGDPFTSVGALRDPLGDRLHVVWAMSKDFAMSGLRTGVLISEHEALLSTMDVQGSWAGVSGHTQHVLAAMLDDEAWVTTYLTTMRQRLRDTADAVTAVLRAADVPHTTPQAGFFTLCDLRTWLDEPTWDGEERLWRRLLDGVGVNLTPGSACRVAEPGFFRLCYAAGEREVVVEAVRRAVAALG